jgi:ABC-type oligopeptide transport system substrate-binding subunit
MRAKGQLDFFRASWVADYPDAENYLSLFYSRNKTPDGPNYTHYENKVFDSLYLKVLKETDNKNRHKIYREMDSIMMLEAPVVVLYYDEVLRFVNKRITGMGSNPTNLLDLRKVKILPSE